MQPNDMLYGKFNNKYRIESTRLKNWDYGNNGWYFITICTAHRNWWFGEIENGVMRLSETGKIAHRFWNEIPDHLPIVELGEFIVMPNHIHGIVIIDKNIDECGNDMNNVRCNATNVETPNLGVCGTNDHPHHNRTHETHAETPNLGVCGTNDHPHNNRTHETHVETPNLGVSTPPVKNAPNMKNVNPIKTIISTDDATPNNINRHRTYNASQKWYPETLGVIINQYKRMVSINARRIHAGFAWQSGYYDHIIRDSQSYLRINEYIRNNPANWDKDKFWGKPAK